MTEHDNRPDAFVDFVVVDDAFAATYLYHGPASRRPWLKLLAGLAFGFVFILIGLWMYADLAAWEEAGQPERWMNGGILALHALGGKRLVLGLFAGIGLIIMAIAARGWSRDRVVARRSRAT